MSAKKILVKFFVDDPSLIPEWVYEPEKGASRKDGDKRRVEEAEAIGRPELAEVGRVREGRRDNGRNIIKAEDISVVDLPAQLAVQGFALCLQEVNRPKKWILVVPFVRPDNGSTLVIDEEEGEKLNSLAEFFGSTWETVDVWNRNPGKCRGTFNPDTVNCSGRQEAGAKGVLTYTDGGKWDVDALPEADDGLEGLEIDVSEFEEVPPPAMTDANARLLAYARKDISRAKERLARQEAMLSCLLSESEQPTAAERATISLGDGPVLFEGGEDDLLDLLDDLDPAYLEAYGRMCLAETRMCLDEFDKLEKEAELVKEAEIVGRLHADVLELALRQVKEGLYRDFGEVLAEVIKPEQPAATAAFAFAVVAAAAAAFATTAAAATAAFAAADPLDEFKDLLDLLDSLDGLDDLPDPTPTTSDDPSGLDNLDPLDEVPDSKTHQ